ncbi:hypothetical protein EYF80_065191 [Liparis tanakae]|uniref:Uncharacterized protein n=1 Tax=Liparis tanakae TaxID=230148 RepID=A0A4Z2E8Q1_9TELE|nr:hypothetical protein EYF80_065191 [Liparis tanakae]
MVPRELWQGAEPNASGVFSDVPLTATRGREAAFTVTSQGADQWDEGGGACDGWDRGAAATMASAWRRSRWRPTRLGGGAFTDLSVKLGERSVAAVHAAAGGQRALGGRGHGLPLGAVAAAGQLSPQGAAVLGGGAWAERKTSEGPRLGGAAAAPGSGRGGVLCYSRMPRPLLALMERPGSPRFLVMEGMLTEPLKPARFS